MQIPRYRNAPIGSVDSLARSLGVPKSVLQSVAENAEGLYFPPKQHKKDDGTFRETFGARPALKRIQKLVLNRIFRQVSFPEYLLGGILGGSALRNAKIHSGKKVLITEDVKQFFPSITSDIVKQIWKHCFHFPEDVSELLTKLTTHGGVLPQGASTSTYLANMVFWDKEGILVERLKKKGLTYTRYVDDIHISSKRSLSMEEIEWIRKKIGVMFSTKGLQRKASKSNVRTQNDRMSVHNYTVNNPSPTVSKQRRNEIVKSFAEITGMISAGKYDGDVLKQLRSLDGKLRHWKQTEPKKAQPFIDELHKHKQLLTGKTK